MDTARGQAHTFEPCGAGWGRLMGVGATRPPWNGRRWPTALAQTWRCGAAQRGQHSAAQHAAKQPAPLATCDKRRVASGERRARRLGDGPSYRRDER
jgi:hypothetical protein